MKNETNYWRERYWKAERGWFVFAAWTFGWLALLATAAGRSWEPWVFVALCLMAVVGAFLAHHGLKLSRELREIER